VLLMAGNARLPAARWRFRRVQEPVVDVISTTGGSRRNAMMGMLAADENQKGELDESIRRSIRDIPLIARCQEKKTERR